MEPSRRLHRTEVGVVAAYVRANVGRAEEEKARAGRKKTFGGVQDVVLHAPQGNGLRRIQ